MYMYVESIEVFSLQLHSKFGSVVSHASLRLGERCIEKRDIIYAMCVPCHLIHFLKRLHVFLSRNMHMHTLRSKNLIMYVHISIKLIETISLHVLSEESD